MRTLGSARDSAPAVLSVARWLNKYLPRGKGAVPRYIGRVAFWCIQRVIHIHAAWSVASN